MNAAEPDMNALDAALPDPADRHVRTFRVRSTLEQALADVDVMTNLDPEPRWNIAPTDEHPVLTMDEASTRSRWTLGLPRARGPKSSHQRPAGNRR